MVESAEYRRELEQKRSAYAFLSSLFLTLPDEELVASLQELAAAPASDDVGMHEIERYARERQGMPVEETLAELAKDRVHLMRGVNKNELRPPYESLYVSNPAQGTLGSLNRFYAESGCCMSEEVKDSPDQIGVEFSFVEHLLSEELDALDEGDADRAEEAARTRERFLSQHLGRWAYEYAKEMKAAAQEQRAKVIEAEAEVPRAMAAALREGKLGVMDYYEMKNTIADTAMRDSIASMGEGANAPRKK